MDTQYIESILESLELDISSLERGPSRIETNYTQAPGILDCNRQFAITSQSHPSQDYTVLDSEQLAERLSPHKLLLSSSYSLGMESGMLASRGARFFNSLA